MKELCDIVENDSGESFLIINDPELLDFFDVDDLDERIRWYVFSDKKCSVMIIEKNIILGYN